MFPSKEVETMDISFISVNFRSASALSASIRSLEPFFRASSLKAEYIVVNNDPAEKAAIEALIANKSSLSLQAIHTGENIGFGSANMQACRHAQGGILFFLNPDTLFLGGNFQGLINAFQYRPQALYGLALERASGEREAWSSGSFPNLGRTLLYNLGWCPRPAPWRTKKILRTDWVSGAALAIRKDFFETLGGFDQRFFLYFEDVDLALRAKKAGGFVAVYPFLRFLHHGGESHTSKSVQKRYFYRSQLSFFVKWRPWYESALILGAQKILRYR